MTTSSDLELIPGEEQLSNQTFQSSSEYKLFWNRLLASVSDELKRLAEARRGSEEDAKRRWLR